MALHNDVPPFDIEIAFVEARDGAPTGKVTYVKLSELASGKSGRGQ